ncbi:MAG: dihydrofolate reductase [Oscillospiraceae bacterium]
MTAIVCVDKNWAIGRENRLLFRISADLKHFRALTTGKTVVMGKNTLLSAAGG